MHNKMWIVWISKETNIFFVQVAQFTITPLIIQDGSPTQTHPSFLPEKVGQEESRPKKITKKGDSISRKFAGMLIFYELVE